MLPLDSQQCPASLPICPRFAGTSSITRGPQSALGLPGDQRQFLSLGPVQAASPGPEFLEFCGGKGHTLQPVKARSGLNGSVASVVCLAYPFLAEDRHAPTQTDSMMDVEKQPNVPH